jgi:3',5'-cyclic-AMP phosphodiesterase
MMLFFMAVSRFRPVVFQGGASSSGLGRGLAGRKVIMEFVEAEYPRPGHFLLHMSDLHLVGSGNLYGQLDAEARLSQAFDAVKASGARPEAIIFTGDLTNQGDPDAYRKLRAIAEPAAVELGAQLIWVIGNHDHRANLRSLLLREEPSDAPLDRSYYLGGLRILVLDTTVPGFHHGELAPEQLEWLASELSTPAEEGTLLALHHPPVPPIQDLAVLAELRNQKALAEVLEGSDVLAILAGHVHYSTSSVFAGIPVSVASSTCYTQDLKVQVGGMRGQDGAQSFNFVHVYGKTVVNSVVPVDSCRTVGLLVPPEEAAKRLADAGVRIPPAPRVLQKLQR